MISKPIVAIGDRKGLLACFANRVSRRSNVMTDDFVDSLTSRTGIERGGCCGRHGDLVRLLRIGYGFAKALKLFRKLIAVREPQPTPLHFQKALA